ncbi:MAG: hybrid sensory histidine kinase BarA [Methanoregula sp. PtaU1.Bin051]|nr:MAG: hybrid sensory histidine kinase BarA [Methanoregula sp. PtaU1.Bin051]
MKGDDTTKRRPLSLIWYLIGFIALIIGIVVVSSLTISYIKAKEEIEYDYAVLQNNTDSNAAESVRLVNEGLGLLDEQYNPILKRSLEKFSEAYQESGNDPSAMNLSSIRSGIAPEYPKNSVNLYVIDENGVIVYSTLPDALGIDFSLYPDFYQSLTKVRLGSDFAADPVVRSIENASDFNVIGTLRKFAYLPSPDHLYVLEIGVESPEFADVRSRYSYQEMAVRLLAINPDLAGIRVYDPNGNVAAQAGIIGAGGRQYADMARENRSGFSVPDSGSGTLSRYVYVDLRDPAAVSDTSVVVELVYSMSRLDAALADLITSYLLIGICAIAIGIALAYAAFRKLTGGIRAIVADVEQIAGGDLSHIIRGVNTSEFAHLEESINVMIRKILEYSEELERKKAELKVASDIQNAFLPKEIPHPAGFDLAAESHPAREVGGDFYDVFSEGDGRYALVIADVAGKGVPASLFMALSRTVVRIVSRWEKTARHAITSSNTTFIRDAGSTSFVTLFYALLDEKRRTLTYVNAGHNPPLLRHADGTVEELSPTGPVIGIMDEPGYGERTITLEQGDVLVMYTDGVSEAMNGNKEMFTEERLLAVIHKNYTLPACGIVGAIRQAVGSFCGIEPQSDDITIMVLKAE